jgi:hypothetical protein
LHYLLRPLGPSGPGGFGFLSPDENFIEVEIGLNRSPVVSFQCQGIRTTPPRNLPKCLYYPEDEGKTAVKEISIGSFLELQIIHTTVRKPEVDLLTLCKENYEYFSKLEGSQHIATFSSQLNFVEQLVCSKADRVLDFGSGIGTFVPLILSKSNSKIYAVEKNEWCKNQFSVNILTNPTIDSDRVNLSGSIPALNFNVVVIDDDISRSEIHQILKGRNLSLIFVEGWRNRTVGHISKRLWIFGYCAVFHRGKSRLLEAERVGERGEKFEKAGSYFLLVPGNPFQSFKSWLKRISKTGELTELFKEFYYWVSRSISLRSRIKKIIDR